MLVFLNVCLWIAWGLVAVFVAAVFESSGGAPEAVAGRICGRVAVDYAAGYLLFKVAAKDKQSLVEKFAAYFGSLIILTVLQLYGR